MPSVQFQSVESLHSKKSLFDLSFEHNTTGDMGTLIPIMVKEAVPSDTWKLENRMIIRMAPLIAPIYHPINVKTFTFFVPNRILYPKPRNPIELSDIDHSWENFITGGEDGQDDSVLPLWTPTDSTSAHTVWDYMGMPKHANIPSGSLPSILALRAYNLIYNEYFRDQNLQDWTDLDDQNLKHACWEKDYFTSSLPFQQRGTSPAIPLQGLSAGAVFDGTVPTFFPNTIAGQSTSLNMGYTTSPGTNLPLNSIGYLGGWDSTNTTGAPVQPFVFNQPMTSPYTAYPIFSTGNGTAGGSGTTYGTFRTGLLVNADFQTWLNNNSINFDTSGGIDIHLMRTAFQTQKWLERNARCGARYTEQLKARFNETAGDARLDRPEFIGGTKTPIVISEVLQTAQNPSATGGQLSSQLGTMAGHGITADTNYIGTYRCKEHGWIITLLCIRPETSYAQGIDLQYTRRSRYDYLTPEFVNLSERAVFNRELYVTNDETYNSEIFGYQGIFNEYRYSKNLSTGLMISDFAHWNLTRLFNDSQKPTLNSDFVTCNPDKRIFAVPLEPGFFINYGAFNNVVRPLPIFAEPGLLDHH